MTSKNEKLNNILKFVSTYNSLSNSKKISQLEALKVYLVNEKK